MKQVVLQGLQTAINRFLALDPESASRLKALQGKVAVIKLKMVKPLVFALFFHEKHIDILSAIPDEPDLIITGMPLSLLRLSFSKNKRDHFFGDNVTIEGNLDLGQQVTDLFDQLDIDWEEIVSKWIGDVPAHQAGRVARELNQFAERVCEAMTRNINEYVHEESEWFPPREALQDFFNDVDNLRMDVDRTEARIEKIKRGLQ